MSDHVHIVCFEAPSPPDYGGAIDVYYKIKCLSQTGKKIILHYFDHKKNRDVDGLEKYCFKIYFYKRKIVLAGFSTTKPYIVSSRINYDLIKNLNKDDYPIIIEGIHGTGITPYLINKNRKVIIRIFNNEEVYYSQLKTNEKSFFKRFYYNWESKLLKQYQTQLSDRNSYAFLSSSDKEAFTELYNLKNIHFIPCLLPWQKVTSLPGLGSYCLYHGNLGISENEKAVLWLINNVFNNLSVKFIVAGKNPSQLLINSAKKTNTTIIENPSDIKLDELLKNAHIHVLPSFNKTGVKLKILHALFHGRFCLTNYAGVEGSGLDQFVIIAETANEFQEKINELMKVSFTQNDIFKREQILDLYNNEKNALRFKALL